MVLGAYRKVSADWTKDSKAAYNMGFATNGVDVVVQTVVLSTYICRVDTLVHLNPAWRKALKR